MVTDFNGELHELLIYTEIQDASKGLVSYTTAKKKVSGKPNFATKGCVMESVFGAINYRCMHVK
ncbi:hypothetical protein TSUD_255120 [Trifolium subterraneum]|uniref:Uncharacterized protein n=1 Tax=Trifolium subterraneum TaxID=3900 RepID=A0A2Z6MUR0_TRISU|nr:hypothetical protein TSUD_255120 [Trifolium subterraneum]